MSNTRKSERHPFSGAAAISVTVIQFGKPEQIETTVKGIDISDGGLGISSEIPLAPGFVWFRSRISDHGGGMIVWSRKMEGGYRAGIQFLPIPASPRDYLQPAGE